MEKQHLESSNPAKGAGDSAGAAVNSIENCVRPLDRSAAAIYIEKSIGPSKRSSSADPPRYERTAYGIALAALIIYLCIAVAATKYCYRVSQHAADPLPAKLDVLMTGSSVIAVPLLSYEYPNQDLRILLDRKPVLEVPKTERILSSFGASHPVIYNGSNIGQSVEETEEFVKGFLALGKRPRLLVLWVAPIAVLLPPAKKPEQSTWISAVNRYRQIVRDSDDARAMAKMRLFHLIAHVYSRLHVAQEHREVYLGRVQNHYADVYQDDEISTRKLGVVADILDMCNSHSIATLMVSAPLAPENRALMPPGLYDKYSNTMRETAQAHNTQFIDLGQSPEFIGGVDFHDPAHCNADGCVKMIDAIAPQLVQSVNNRSTDTGATLEKEPTPVPDS